MARIKEDFTPRKDGKSRWRLDSTDRSGRRKREFFMTKEEAEAQLLTYQQASLEGGHVHSNETVATAAAELIKNKTALGRSRATIKELEFLTGNYIIPAFGRRQLSSIHTADVAKFLEGLMADGKSPVLVRKVRGAFVAIFKRSMALGKARTNPVSAYTIEVHSDHRAKAAVAVPSIAEVKALLETARADGVRSLALLSVLVFTGIRIGELRALRCQDIDLDAGLLHVRQAADKWGKIKAPKTHAGVRSIPIGPSLIATLRVWMQQCPETETGLLFGTRNGTPISISNLMRDYWHPLQRKAGVVQGGKVSFGGFHCLRHFAASNYIAAGCAATEVQSHLGHANVAITMSIYAHLLEGQKDHAAVAAQIEAGMAVGNGTAVEQKSVSNFPNLREVSNA